MLNENFLGFAPSSKVWVYPSPRKLSTQEIAWLNDALTKFTGGWTAHEMPLKAAAAVLHEQFVVIMVDESIHAVSGCGIDKSVHFMQEAGRHLNINFFDRLKVHFLQGAEVLTFTLAELDAQIETGKIEGHSLFFNNLVASKAALEQNWIQPLSESWLKNRIKLPA